MKRLIVNADDFGLHTQINNGIIKGYREGFITSTSIMPSAPAYKEAVALARENHGLGIGIHLTLVGGVSPVLPRNRVTSLLDAEGVFLPDYGAFAKRYYSGGIKSSELESELRAQIERVLESGLNITHLDSHQHLHVLPGVNRLVLKLGCEYNIRRMRIPYEPYLFKGGFEAGMVRIIGKCGLSFCASLASMGAKDSGIVHPDYFFGMLAGGNLNEELVGNILCSLPDGTSEIMTHPGMNKCELDKHFNWNYHWEEELQAFLSEKNKALLKEERIALVNFGGLDL